MAILICKTCGIGFGSSDTNETQCPVCKAIILTPKVLVPHVLNCKECNRTFEPTNDHARGICPVCEIHICNGIGFDPSTDQCPACPTVTAESPLKVFLALVSFDGHDTGPISNIEMTILHITSQRARAKVTEILKDQGYPTWDMNVVVKEIRGPFEAGYVLARHGG